MKTFLCIRSDGAACKLLGETNSIGDRHCRVKAGLCFRPTGENYRAPVSCPLATEPDLASLIGVTMMTRWRPGEPSAIAPGTVPLFKPDPTPLQKRVWDRFDGEKAPGWRAIVVTDGLAYRAVGAFGMATPHTFIDTASEDVLRALLGERDEAQPRG